MRALILAAGLGTRLKPYTDHHPKALFPIGGKSLLEWQVEMLHQAGITDITVNVHHFADQVVRFVAERWPDIRISDETNLLLETGGAIRKVWWDRQQEKAEPLLVLNVDILSTIDLRAFVASYREEDYATVVVSDRSTQRYFCFDSDLRMTGWTNIKTGEVKGVATIATDVMNATGGNESRLLAFSGMHILSPRALAEMADWPERFSVTDFYIDRCASRSIRAYVPANYRMMDIGKTECLAEAERFVSTLSR